MKHKWKFVHPQEKGEINCGASIQWMLYLAKNKTKKTQKTIDSYNRMNESQRV